MTVRTSSNPLYSNLVTAAAAAASTGLVIDSPVTLSSSLSIEVPVEVEPGGAIKVADGMTLTFTEPFTAPPIRIFIRDPGWGGAVLFGNGNVEIPTTIYGDNPATPEYDPNIMMAPEIREAVWVTPSWWEDDTYNDTDAVNIALGYNRVRFTRRYRVTSVKSEAIYQMIDMAGFFLHGIAPTPKPDPNNPNAPIKPSVEAVLILRNWRDGRMFNAGITSDGDQKVPKHALNYKCGLLCDSEAATHENRTQYSYIYGLRIQNMMTGIAWGRYSGDPTAPGDAQERRNQSEFHIYDYSPRGVLAPFVGNASNAFLQIHNSILGAEQNEASTKGSGTGWWRDEDGRTVVNLVGSLRLTGGSIQRAITAGYNLEGGDIVVENCDIERACSDKLTGDVTYRSCRNGHYGWPNTVPSPPPVPFKVAAGATGRLLLEDMVIRRDEGIANGSSHNLVDASEAPNYEIVFRDTVVKQWRIGANTASSYLVHGGRVLFGDLTVDNSGSTAASYRLREGANRLTTADPTGRAMSTVNDDLSPKGGWVSIGASSGGFHRITSDLPPDATEAIRLRATGAGVEIVTDKAFPVESGQSRIVDFWLKYTGATGSLRADLRWFDANPTPGLISQFVLLSQDQARLADNGFSNWLRFRAVGKAPNGAVAAKLSFYLGAGADLMITDIRVI
ncbi:hypothetical protein FFK22_026580 [Mycobacterium sp. KBS0706]|uniref:hypothetical protein n=1 Tax=Mycobacterium sp. KBS0706 TaxID=2578109 RepID=UPI00110FB881|nr:hypothetical protein [Mycobacterium sp. KBS0706]TSD85614.1 hypothetical protein FFK22_026580 [Mycobacterium sp. KBS0706]